MKFQKIDVSTEDFSCYCCEKTMPDFVAQNLEDHRDSASLLYTDIKQWTEDGFARFTEPLLVRLVELEGKSARFLHACDVVSRQIANSAQADKAETPSQMDVQAVQNRP